LTSTLWRSRRSIGDATLLWVVRMEVSICIMEGLEREMEGHNVVGGQISECTKG
jgi:hypothetical protein